MHSNGGGKTAFGGPHAGTAPSSGGAQTRFEDVLTQFSDGGASLPPELLNEQRALLLRPGDIVGERFEVVKLLGFGGMGAVYHVKDRRLGLHKALKVMLPSLLKNEMAIKRFLAEVAISQQLRHENIVAVFDLAVDKARRFYFFTMEYVPGVTLHKFLAQRGGKLPVKEVLDFAQQICSALDYAHRYTIHRDLKPQNIMVRPDGRVKLLDFGLAKVMSPGRMTKSSMALGTAYYQAPEQSIKLAEVDQCADLYSLGVILYQMLTGEMPVGRFLPPSEVTRGVPKALDEAILKCLEPKPENRYGSAAECGASLDLSARRSSSSKPKSYLKRAVALIVVATVACSIFAATRTGFAERLSEFLAQMQQSQQKAKPEPAPEPQKQLEPAPQDKSTEPEGKFVKFDDRIFLPGSNFQIEKFENTVRYRAKGRFTGGNVCLCAYLSFSAELENGAMLAGRAVLSTGSLSDTSSLVRIPDIESILQDVYTDPNGLLAASSAVALRAGSARLGRMVILITSEGTSTSRHTNDELGSGFSRLSVADSTITLRDFVFATTCQAQLPYGAWEQTGANGFTLSMFNVDTSSSLDCIVYYYLTSSVLQPPQFTPHELTIGDLLVGDVEAKSNIIEVNKTVIAQDWKQFPAEPMFVQAAAETAPEQPSYKPTMLVEELPDGGKRLVLKGDPTATQRAQSQWMERQQLQPQQLSIQEQRALAKQARQAAANQEAARKQQELDRASREHYQKWRGHDGALPSLR